MRILLFLLLTAPAFAQAPACAPQNITLQVTGRPYLPPSSRASLAVPVTICPEPDVQPPEPTEDILHGPTTPTGLLKGQGPANLLTNRYTQSVTLTPRPPAPGP